MKVASILTTLVLSAAAPTLASAQVATSCSEAYNNCMGARGNRSNGPQQGEACRSLKAQCMATGKWQTRFQQLTNLKRQ